MNETENSSGRKHFRKYYAKVNPKYGRSVRRSSLSGAATIVGAICTVLTFIFSPLPTDIGNILIGLVTFIVTIIGIYFLVSERRQRDDKLIDIKPPEGKEFYTFSWPRSLNDESYMHQEDCKRIGEHIASIQPNKTDQDLGFVQVRPGMGCLEPSFSSADTDNWLLTQPDINIDIETSTIDHAYLGNVAQSQWRYLLARVDGSQKMQNDPKVRFCSDFGKPEQKTARIQKCDYFDSVLTNEAFRSIVYERTSGSGFPGSIRDDFTRHYNFGRSDPFPSLAATPAGNHIGASVLVISKDNLPIFFLQGKNQAISGTNFVVTGSGSVDWQDHLETEHRSKLLNLIRFSMFREYFEEGQSEEFRGEQIKELASSPSNFYLRNLSEKVLIIGYFRWVSRMGKPEFTGVYRSTLNHSQIRPDGKEVTELPDWFSIPEIHTVMDFLKLRDRLNDLAELQERGHEPLRLSLSSAMTIHRLAEIAEKGTDQEKTILADALDISIK